MDSQIIKLCYGDSIMKLQLKPVTFDQLKTKVVHYFSVTISQVKFTYIDDEGDANKIVDDDTLAAAFGSKIVKITVEGKLNIMYVCKLVLHTRREQCQEKL